MKITETKNNRKEESNSIIKNTLIKTSEINIRNILQGYLNLKDL
jgi:hypothetical protein